MISFAESRCTTELDRDRKKGSMMARGAGRGDYSREEIILSISVRGGRLFEGGDQSRDSHYSRKYGNLK